MLIAKTHTFREGQKLLKEETTYKIEKKLMLCFNINTNVGKNETSAIFLLMAFL